jgi:hypothetical protein
MVFTVLQISNEVGVVSFFCLVPIEVYSIYCNNILLTFWRDIYSFEGNHYHDEVEYCPDLGARTYKMICYCELESIFAQIYHWLFIPPLLVYINY